MHMEDEPLPQRREASRPRNQTGRMAQAPLHEASVAQDEERKAANRANWMAAGGSKCTDALPGRSDEDRDWLEKEGWLAEHKAAQTRASEARRTELSQGDWKSASSLQRSREHLHFAGPNVRGKAGPTAGRAEGRITRPCSAACRWASP